MYDPKIWLIDGKPGTGSTPIEQLLWQILAVWYFASIVPLIIALQSSSTLAKQVAIIGPMTYHISISLTAFLFWGNLNVSNSEKLPPGLEGHHAAGIIHMIFGLICYVPYKGLEG